jgi:hypothetical protein
MIIDANGKTIMEYYREFWKIAGDSASMQCKYLVLGFFFLIIYYCIFGSPLERRYLGLQNLILVLGLFNPVSMYIMGRYIGLSSRYFRYLWIVPIMITYGYFAASLLLHKTTGFRTVLAYILSFAALYIGAMQLKDSTKLLYTSVKYNNGMETVDNKYKIERDTYDAASIIEADKQDENKAVKVLYGYEIFMDIRTYDASIYNGFDLSDQNKYRTAVITQEDADKLISKNKYSRLLLMMVNISANYNASFPVIPQDALEQALQEENMEYAIVYKQSPYCEAFTRCGEVIGETDYFTVVKYGGM